MKLKLRSAEKPSVATAPDEARRDAARVAVIDDEPGNVAALEALMRTEFQVLGFTDPMAALEHLEREPVDVILTDQRMPGLLGTELLMRLKTHGLESNAVIVTGYTDVKDLVFCINEGLISRYVLKPWEPDDVRAAVRAGVRSVRETRALHRLVPRQVLGRVFPEGLEGVAPGRSMQLGCAVMFADLRGFSAVAESLSAEDAYALLAQYFEVVTPVIAGHGGFVDKFLGDGVLAIFDGPGDYAATAVACAREIDRRVRRLTGLVQGQAVRPGGWRVGIGLAMGTATLGTIGCPDRVEITVLGDTVNTAARLEETCKALGSTVLMQAELATNDLPDYRPLGFVPLRGKERISAVGELLCVPHEGLAPASALRELVELQSTGRLDESLERMRRLAADHPKDSVLGGVVQLWDRQRARG